MERVQCSNCGAWYNKDGICPHCGNQKQSTLKNFRKILAKAL
ncbi:MAG: hypothetical protein U9Q69_02855 [Nanoarchaeota archaeon]|nr:hypothetical protein [Nanoarchaeota archaeon]